MNEREVDLMKSTLESQRACENEPVPEVEEVQDHEPTHEDIAQRAYHKWMERGAEQSSEEQEKSDWRTSEAELYELWDWYQAQHPQVEMGDDA